MTPTAPDRLFACPELRPLALAPPTCSAAPRSMLEGFAAPVTALAIDPSAMLHHHVVSETFVYVYESFHVSGAGPRRRTAGRSGGSAASRGSYRTTTAATLAATDQTW